MDPKSIVNPLQQWLLGQGRCVGCGRTLSKERKEKKNGVFKITCHCRRVFIYESEADAYRRASFEEA